MHITENVKHILRWYESDNAGTKTNLARLLMQGKLGGTGKMIILPVDQGFEHGPARSFASNPAAYDPHYHFQLSLDAGLSGYAAPLGFLRGRCRYVRRSDSYHFKSQQRQLALSFRPEPPLLSRQLPHRSKMRCVSDARPSASRSILAAPVRMR